MHLRSKRKYSFEDFSEKKKIRLSKRRNTTGLEHVINLGIPHVGEQIFESLNTDDLLQCTRVSKTWKFLAENVLLQRWKGKMFEACETGKTEIVKLLLKHFNSEESGLNVKDDRERTSFIIACQNGHKDVVEMLLNHSKGNIDFNAGEEDGWTSFMWACSEGHRDVVKLLLDNSEANINFNARDKIGSTAFMWACWSGHKDVVQLLLEQSGGNIDFNATNNHGRTAFMEACRKSHKNVVQLLLKCAKAKGIQIPSSQSILFGNVSEEIMEDIKNLIDEYVSRRKVV